MRNNQVQIEIPLKFKDELRSAGRVFLSVNPVVAFSDVLIALDELYKESDTEFDISSIDKLHELHDTNTSKLIIACGDMPLKEIPSRLRGLVAQRKMDGRVLDESRPPWLVLRVHVSDSKNHLFEFLSSSEIEQPSPNLCDTSWSDLALIARRFDKVKKISGPDGEEEKTILPNLSKHVVEGDLEFLE